MHFKEKQYDFSDVEKYNWKTDESIKSLVLYLNDGTVLDLNGDGAFSDMQGDYDVAEKQIWPQ